ncbi:MAG: hypothetical protein ACUVX8_01085 [Candidatus Zipacnadales bacterium]
MGMIVALVFLDVWAQAQEGFVDHGVAASAAESRGVVCLQDANGRSIAICCAWDHSPRGWILIVEADTGKIEQLFYPDGVPNSAPFASLMSKNGRFYTFAGKVLLELNPTTREWLFHGTPAPSEVCYGGQAMCDGPDGLIYAGSYPNCRLVSFDPHTKAMQDLVQLDPVEHYVTSLVADTEGWLYAGIGTARANIVAYRPQTGELRQIVEEADRVLGSAGVRAGKDGSAYGRCGDKYYRLSGGRGVVISPEEYGPLVPTGAIEWGVRSGTFPDGRRLKLLNLPERFLEVENPKSGEIKRYEFTYESGGAAITSVGVGPDDRIYGSSCHPMHFFMYDPPTGKLEDWGGLERVGGGNWCALATQRQYVFGAAYAGGFLYCYDTTKSWNNETGDDPNPKLIAEWPEDICRPRACLAHPDGRHVIMAGFMGYGRTGGGLGFYDLETGKTTLLKHTEVIPGHSTITLTALPNGDLVGGTSVETPGGGHPVATEGVLYVMNWATRTVTFQMVPVPGEREVWSLQYAPDGLVYGLTSGSQLFVFDPTIRQVVHREALSQYGGLPRHLCLFPRDNSLVILFSRSIVRLTLGSFTHEKIAETPVGVNAGGAIVENRLYFASGSHLWSYALPHP